MPCDVLTSFPLVSRTPLLMSSCVATVNSILVLPRLRYHDMQYIYILFFTLSVSSLKSDSAKKIMMRLMTS